MRTSQPITRTAASAVVIIGAALLGAGCGGSSPPAKANGSAPQTPGQAAYRFARCMRSHGIANFPDPVVRVSGNKVAVGIRVTPALTSQPAFKAAQKSCQGLLPGPPNPQQLAQQQHQRALHLLSFAQCIRHRGISNFPDPNSQGQIDPQTLSAAGIDLQAPDLLAAAKACIPASGGAVTEADIARAAAGGQASGSGSGSGQASGGG